MTVFAARSLRGRAAVAVLFAGLASPAGPAPALAADLLTGTAAPDVLAGKPGASEIRGLAGSDVLFGDPASGVGPITAIRVLSRTTAACGELLSGGAHPSISPDGRRVAYTAGQGLLPWQPGLTLVHDLPSGTLACLGDGRRPVFSPDGRTIAVESFAPNEADPEHPLRLLVLRGLDTGVSTKIAVQRLDEYSEGLDFSPSFSRDGRMVAFNGGVSVCPDDELGWWLRERVVVRDLATGQERSLFEPCALSKGGHDPALSPDGTRVAFASFDDMVGDAGAGGVFEMDLASGAIRRLSTSQTGTPGNGASGHPVYSPDGRKLAFSSSATNLLAGDTNGVEDVFVKDLASGAIARASTSATGAQAVGGGSGGSPFDVAAPRQIAFSPDGTRVAFASSATNLVANDTNGADDIFVKDLATGALARVSTTAAGGQSNEAPGDFPLPTFAPDDTRIAFDSDASNLAPGIAGAQTNVFLATLPPGPVGSDVIYAGSGDDRVYGAGGNDRLVGDLGVDLLDGGPGDDSLNGGDGPDLLVGGPGHDRVNGGAALDRASFEAAPAAITAAVDAAGNGTASGGDADTLSSIESLLGSRFGDTLANAVDFGRLEGGPGNDRLIGSAASVKGQRVVFDTAASPVHVDLKLGVKRNRDGYPASEGVDTLTDIRLIGGSPLPQGDVLIGNDLANKIQGLAGPDVITGNGGPDQLLYFSVDDSPAFAPDVITDFRRGQGDRIHLLALGPLTWIGSKPFSGTRQIRASLVGTTTLVEVNATGDLAADMAIRLENVTAFDPIKDLVQP